MKLKLNCGGAIAGPGFGRFTPLPNPGESLYAGWLLGTAYGDTPLADASGNGHDLTLTGNGLGEKWLAAGQTSYADVPFDTADLIAAGDGSFSLVCVTKTPAANKAMPFSNYNGSGVAAASIAETSVTNAAQTFTNGASASLAYDAARGDVFTFLMGVALPGAAKIFRRRPGGAMQSATTVNANNYGNASNLRIGRALTDTGNWYGATSIALAAVYLGDRAGDAAAISAELFALLQDFDVVAGT